MSPAFYLPLSWDIQAEAELEHRAHVSGLSGEVEVWTPNSPGWFIVKPVSTRSGALFLLVSVIFVARLRSAQILTSPKPEQQSQVQVKSLSSHHPGSSGIPMDHRTHSIVGAPWDLEVASTTRDWWSDLEGQRIFR